MSDEHVKLELKEIYKLLCPDCRDRLRDLVKSKISDLSVKKVLEE